MKKLINFCVMFITTLTCYSQPNDHSYEATAESVEILMIRELMKQIEDLQRQQISNATVIDALLAGRELDAKTKYDLVKHNLIHALETFHTFNDKINDLKSRNSSNKLDNFIKDLNNPQSNTLGFKLDDIIIKLVNEHIQIRKRSTATKVMETINGITSSPLSYAIPTLSPALSIANSVLIVLRSTGITTDEIDHQKIQNFEKALNNYIQYYVELNDANQSFNFNLDHQKQELGLLQQKLYEQAIFFARTLHFPVKQKGNEDMSLYLNALFLEFDKKYINNLFAELEAKYKNPDNKINYELLLHQHPNLKDANNRLEEFIGLINQFEFMSNEYFNIYELYNSKIIKALDLAVATRIADARIVNNRKNEFTRLKDQALIDIKVSLNLPDLKSKKQNIKYTARIL